MRHRKTLQWKIVLAIGLGSFVTSFDSSAITSALPVIMHALHSNPAAAKWVITLYVWSISSVLLLSGRLGDLLGYRNLYLAGLCISFIGACLCIGSTSIYALAISRMAEALGIVCIIANGTALVVKNCLPQQRGRSLGQLSAVIFLGLTAGPVLSGWLCGHFGWPSIFIAELPMIATALAFGIHALPRDRPAEEVKPINIPANIFMALSLTALVLAFHWSASLGWNSNPVLSLSGAALASLVLALYANRNSNLKAILGPAVTIASFSALLSYVSLYSISFILPFYLLDVLAVTPLQMGLLLAIRPLATAVLTPLSGALADRYGPGPVLLSGLTLLFLAYFTFIHLNSGSTFPELAISLSLTGAGMGLLLPPNHSLIFGETEPGNRGTASALIALTRNLGMLIGISLGASLFPFHQPNSAPAINAINRAAHSVFYLAPVIAGVALLTMILFHLLSFQNTPGTAHTKPAA